MTRWPRAIVVVVAVIAGLSAAAGILHARETAFPGGQTPERLLYLRSGKTADRLMLSFDALAADVYWIRTIQHYGRDRKAPNVRDRFSLLYPLLDLTTTLDPHFNVAYRFGWIFLATPPNDGAGRTDLALALLEKGLRANPARWQYAYDAGFVHYWYTGDYRAAAEWFTRASKIPGAPNWLVPLAAATKAQGGDRNEARRMLRALLESEDKYIRGAANRGLQQLAMLDVIDHLQDAVNAYFAANKRYPLSWLDLVEARLLPGIPVDAEGRQVFIYDAATHEVSLTPDSPLQPLPRTMVRR